MRPMLRNCFAVLAALTVLAACGRDDSAGGASRTGALEPKPTPTAAQAAGAAGAPATEPSALAVANGAAPATQETAEQYIARRGANEPFAPGEIAPSAVGEITVCAVCHGPNGEGNPTLHVPRIGGLPGWYIARELTNFRDGLRAATDADVFGTQMRAIALTFDSEEQIEDLADYVATLHPPPAPVLGGGDVQHGQELYKVCSACHGPDAKGSAALNTPSMVEQSGDYLIGQLEHFQTGVRGASPSDTFGAQMRAIASTVLKNRSDAVDVVAYIMSLRGGAQQRQPSSSATQPSAGETKQSASAAPGANRG